MWPGVKVNRTSRPRRVGQQSAKTLPTRGELQIEDLSVGDLHHFKNDPRIKNKRTNFAVSLPRPELRNLRTLRPYQHNARTHSKRQIEQIARSIERFGFLNPVLIDASGGIIAGHGRVEAARQLGLSQVPTLRIEHLTDTEKRAYILADNKLAAKAGWDREILAIELQTLVDMDFEIELAGFEMGEVDLILDEATEIKQAPLLPEDSVPEVSAGRPAIKRGDLWLLGAHRLYCGDARDERAYDGLMKGTKAEFVFTDPPYNVPIDGHVSGLGRIRHREFEMASGEMGQAEYTTFLEKVFRLLCAYTENGSIHDICIDWRHVFEMLVAGRAVYHELKNICVWNKSNAGMGSFYRSQHELILIWKNGTQPHINNFELGQYGRSRTNIWNYAGVNSFKRERAAELAMHPTTKSALLVSDAIRDCSRRGGLVLDPFAGSGTVVIAAERTGRKARVIEIDQAYCDLIVKRWQEYTGKRATHGRTGAEFDDVETREQRGSTDAKSKRRRKPA
jgi:DNA modification methylase